MDGAFVSMPVVHGDSLTAAPPLGLVQSLDSHAVFYSSSVCSVKYLENLRRTSVRLFVLWNNSLKFAFLSAPPDLLGACFPCGLDILPLCDSRGLVGWVDEVGKYLILVLTFFGVHSPDAFVVDLLNLLLKSRVHE